MTFNQVKCKVMHVSCKRIPLSPVTPLTINGAALETVSTFKYLGLLLTVSYYYHYVSGNGLFEFSGTLTWEIFFKLFMDDKTYFGSWFDHVLEWWKHRDDPNVLFFKYEDIHKDHPGAVRAMAEFIGVDLKPDVVDKIVKESGFDRMKANPNTNFSFMPSGSFALNYINPFLRKGIVGDWKSHFTANQLSTFEAVYQEKMKYSGLDFGCGS